MFDILELDEILCLQLDKKSLLQCARVNKQWNQAAIPFIWRTIPTSSLDRLCEHVREDYLQEQYLPEQQGLEDQPPPAKKLRQAQSSKKPPPQLERWQKPDLALTRYGHCVRQVEGFSQLLKEHASVNVHHSRQSKAPEHQAIPSALDLAQHFLKRSPNALFDFEVTTDIFTSDELFDFALTSVLPKVTALTISGDYDVDDNVGDENDIRIPVPFSKIQQVLAASSTHLYSLCLAISNFQIVKESNEGIASTNNTLDLEVTARPKCLKIHDFVGNMHDQNSQLGWSWIWGQCSQVQELEVHRLCWQVAGNLGNGIQASMLQLDRVIFGRSLTALYTSRDGLELHDDEIWHILGAGKERWKSAHFGYSAEVGFRTCNLLPELGATLEELSMVRVSDSTVLIRVLKACPKLRKLVTIDDDQHGKCNIPAITIVPEIAVMDFIDWDPETKALQPWPCALTLETLAIKITDFPGPDTSRGLHQEAEDYNVIQQRLCQRLGDFANLKVLKLGHTAWINSITTFSYRLSVWYTSKESMVPKQDNCIHLTYATGLRKLEGLTKLEELHIPNMDHQVKDVQEVKWMVEHWPRLSKLHGINPQTDAHKWLKAECPNISLSQKHPGY